jgi:hypothetical protein
VNRIAIAVAAFVLWSAAMVGAGWAWRGDRAERDETDNLLSNTTQVLEQERSARTDEHKQAGNLAAIGARHEEDRTAATAVPATVVAGVRDGSLQLRDDLATCSTARLSEAVARTIERDAHAELRAEVAGAIVQIGRDADDHVRSCQAVIAVDRGMDSVADGG